MAWVWPIAKSDNVMWPMTSWVHPPATRSKLNPPSKHCNVNTATKNLIVRQKCLACMCSTKYWNNWYWWATRLTTNKRGKWMETLLYALSDKDREILLSPTGWLNNNLIVAAQNILRKQSSVPGFQDTCLGSSAQWKNVLLAWDSQSHFKFNEESLSRYYMMDVVIGWL